MAELQDSFGVEATLIKGEKGVYDVTVDGSLVYSKHATGRFPEPGEVVDLIKKLDS